MPRPTKRQNQSRKAARENIKRNIDSVDNVSVCDDPKDNDNDNEQEDYDDTGNFPIYDELVESDNAINIVRKLQEAAKKYHQEHASHKIRSLRYMGNSSRTKRRKKHQQREAAKGSLTLHTFWDT